MRPGLKTSRRGFTAVEIAMVATVIAILALLILPIFRKRSEDARIAAVEDELQSLTKALLLVEADMPGGNFLPRLSDLDNRDFSAESAPPPGTRPSLEPPRAYWDYTPSLSPFGRFIHITADPTPLNYDTITENWRGPYVAFKNTVFLGELQVNSDPLWNSLGGPVYYYPGLDEADDLYPADPWGTPYILFGPEETSYNLRALYSLGPDRQAGITGVTPADPRSWRQALESGARVGADYYFYF